MIGLPLSKQEEEQEQDKTERKNSVRFMSPSFGVLMDPKSRHFTTLKNFYAATDI